MKTEAQEKLCGFGKPTRKKVPAREGMLKESSFGGTGINWSISLAALVEAKLCMQGLLGLASYSGWVQG